MTIKQNFEDDEISRLLLGAVENVEPSVTLRQQLKDLGEPEKVDMVGKIQVIDNNMINESGERKSKGVAERSEYNEPTNKRRAFPVWATAIAASLVLIAGSVMVLRSVQNETSVTTSDEAPTDGGTASQPTGDYPLYILDPVPEGYETSIPLLDATSTDGQLLLFGSKGDRPFENGDLAISDLPLPSAGSGQESTEKVAGKTVYVSEDSSGVYYAVDLDEGPTSFNSSSMSRSRILELVEIAITEGLAAVEGESGLELLAAINYENQRSSSISYFSISDEGSEEDRIITVDSFSNQNDVLGEYFDHIARIAADPAVEVEVDGVPARYFPAFGNEPSSLSFSAADNTVVAISAGSEFSQEEVIALAEDIRPASPEEKKEFEESYAELGAVEGADELAEGEQYYVADPVPEGFSPEMRYQMPPVDLGELWLFGTAGDSTFADGYLEIVVNTTSEAQVDPEAKAIDVAGAAVYDDGITGTPWFWVQRPEGLLEISSTTLNRTETLEVIEIIVNDGLEALRPGVAGLDPLHIGDQQRHIITTYAPSGSPDSDRSEKFEVRVSHNNPEIVLHYEAHNRSQSAGVDVDVNGEPAFFDFGEPNGDFPESARMSFTDSAGVYYDLTLPASTTEDEAIAFAESLRPATSVDYGAFSG